MNSDRPILYATATTPLGCLLVAGTTDGIVSVKLADTSLKGTLIAQLQQEFGAVEEDKDAPLAEWLQALVDYLQGGMWPELPTRTSGTEFQQQVWQQLRTIPVGTTVSYGDLAEQMGLQPGAARAVGTGLCDKSSGAGGALPSGGGSVWRADGISVGGRAQAGFAGTGTTACGRSTGTATRVSLSAPLPTKA